MATQSKGSILYKILILVLIAGLILVISIPAKIWKEEKQEMKSAQLNMESIYEAEKFYHRLTEAFTTDQEQLLSVISQDSTLKQAQQLVNHTQNLKNLLDSYQNIPYLNSLLIIDQNLSTISSDLKSNERWFKSNEDIGGQAEKLNQKLMVLNSDFEFPNYVEAANIVDTLYQLRRDLSDYNLQTAASRCADLSARLNGLLPNVEFDNLQSKWAQLFQDLTTFRKGLDAAGISKQTSVAARIREFSVDIDENMQLLKSFNKAENIKKAEEISGLLADQYSTFLQDFVVTSKRALYKLAKEDSMVLYISKENFVSPANGQPYILGITPDSSDIKVESPMLLDELLAKIEPIAGSISEFDFIPHYTAYLDTLKSIHQKGLGIKKLLRRNIDITVKNKEIEGRISKYENGSEFSAANDLRQFADLVHNSKSFSDLKEGIEKARNAISIINQIYSENLFANIDSVHKSIIADLEEYNSILSGIRRLPRGVKKFENEESQLEEILLNIKKKSASTDSEMLAKLQASLEDALLFATEGKSIRVYGVFFKKQQNNGYINQSTKSWEEK